MFVCTVDGLHIDLNKAGALEFLKLSVPLRHGRYHEVQTPDHVFQFNLNGEIKYLQGKRGKWPHPAEWMKRSVSNDWIYYSVGSYNDVFDLLGEYYFPCLSYDENPFFKHRPFEVPSVKEALFSLDPLLGKLGQMKRLSLPKPVKAFVDQAVAMTPTVLRRRSRHFHRITGERITVLPPESRHVDYTVIPVVVARGCLYHCGFCRFKTQQAFTPLEKSDILNQMEQMKAFLGQDLSNYNAVFLGQHDALMAGSEILTFSAEKAYDLFELDRSCMKGAWLFLFGSADALLGAEETLFEALNRLPYRTCINIGLESADPETLKRLGKPVGASRVREAFSRLMAVNRAYSNIEVSANFVLGKDLPQNHVPSLLDLAGSAVNRHSGKGGLYFSPLNRRESKQEVLSCFNALKRSFRLPAYVYQAQRL